jgi:nucleotide-binding universal stress UspA family protein
MNDEAKLKENTPSKMGRTIALLVDCLTPGEGGLFGEGSEGLFLLRLAGLLARGSGGRVLLFSVVAVPEGQSVSAFSTTAQALRMELETLAVSALASPGTVGAGLGDIPVTKSQAQTMIAPVVRVAPEHDLASEVRRLLTEEQNLLLLLPLRHSTTNVCPWVRKALRSPLPCDVAWARPPHSGHRPGSAATAPFQTGMRILIPARGGPQAQLALDLSGDLNVALHAEVTMLHVLQTMPESQRATEEAPFTELLDQMALDQSGARAGGMPRRDFITGDDPVKSISEAAAQYDLLIMGAGGEAAADVGSFTQRVARNSPAALLAIKTRVPVGPAIRAARRRARPHALAPEVLSLIVDKWFAENTFHADEFSDLNRLVDIKKQRGVTISVGLPALNEEATIGGVVRVLKKALMDDVPLVDEIVVIDSDSTDRTREIAAELGVPVYIHQQVLPEAGEPVQGKGEALWKSLHVLKGDIIAWVDTDVANMHPQFIYGLIGPLLREPRIGYVKGYYHRPLSTSEGIQHEGGGRVTELTVRPLVNLFFPLLSGVLQPLAGEYAGRREVLENLPFFSGYGVETGMLIDLLESYGLYSIGQVNLEKRIHRNRSLADLSLTAFAIIQVILSRLESRASITLLEEVNRSMKLIRFEDEHLSLEVRKVHDVERPPIITIPAYREARGR